MKKSVNMAAVARACGTSVMTVSRAFRPNRSIDHATRQKILNTATLLGYRVNGSMGRPRQMVKKTRRQARLIMSPGFSEGNLYYSALLGSIEKELARYEYDCLVRTWDGTYDNFVWVGEALRSETPQPTMIIGHFPVARLQILLGLAPEALLVDFTENPQLTCSYNSIGFDNVEAARLAMRHLLAAGCRKPLLIKGDVDHVFSGDIDAGYRDVLKLNGMKTEESLIVSADFTSSGAYQCVLNLIKRRVEFDAVFTNDEMAIGAMRALSEKGRRIPEQVAVCGCDGLFFGKYINPSLTTVVLDYAELGRAAVEHILAAKSNKTMQRRIRLVPKLEIRESTRKK